MLGSFVLLMALGWMVGPGLAYAVDSPTATLTVSQPTLTVGDVITLTLAVTHSTDAGIVPVAPARAWGAFEVRTLSPVTTATNDDGSATSRQQLGVTLWMTGTYGTPPLPVTLVDNVGKQEEVLAQPISVTVTSVLTGADLALRDLKAQAVLPVPPLWPWVLGGVAALLLVASGGWWLYRRWPVRASQAAPPTVIIDPRPAYQIALDELAQLEQLRLPTQRRFKEHYTLATDTLRRYLAGAFAIPALDQTTHEIRQALRETPLSTAQRSQLLAMLSEADLVKFADVTPDEDAAAALVRDARTFVLATKPAPVVSPDNGGSSHAHDAPETDTANHSEVAP
ncbi:MAG: hypothetical protein R3C14_14535 [Caldilineaceae bacterium]